MSAYLDAVGRGIVIFDGATGTWLQSQDLTAEDFGGPDLEGCNELLNVTRPDVIDRLHRAYLDVGAHVVETNTFGAFGVPLGEYGLADRAYELAAAGAAIAREAADSYEDRFVAGSMGPGTKFPTLGQITYADLRDMYEIEAAGLIDGGVDLIIIETQFDLLALRAAINGARRAMAASGRDVPLQTQVTIELTGRMLPGTEIGAALTAMESLGPDIVGMNCATGPVEMYEAVRYLSANSRTPISIIPNAGLPSVVDGAMHYDLGAVEMARHLGAFVREFGVGVVGGCCGTTPAYIAALIDEVGSLAQSPRSATPTAAVTSTYSSVALHQDTSFLIIGERTNANGSKAFRDAMLAGDVDACVAIGESQVAEGAHLVDLCVDYVGRDGAGDIDVLAGRFATEVTAPIVIDSTEPEVMAAALERIGGRSVLNSANLEDGDGPGSRLDRVLRLAHEHGSAVICLLIDERGQARDVEWKMEVAHRLHDIATTRYGLSSGDLIFDALTFPLSTGDDDLRDDAKATIEAIRRIKAELPGVATVLGVSNVSFGLKPAARRALNSVFLHECVEAGLDAAIIHAGKITPLNQIDPDHLTLCLDLIHNRVRPGYDPLEVLLISFEDEAAEQPADPFEGLDLHERLAKRIVMGAVGGLEDDLDAALGTMGAMAIINDVLLGGMKTVGELFASGEMQLPFVLRSAQTMKAAVRYLEPHLDRLESTDRGSIVLATVSGDVHDIGKNLVDIILTNNGFRVHNLGIKVSIAEMIDAYLEHGADAIGMSGLLVKSTLVMRDNLDELMRRGLGDVPVLLGGAALTRRYVEDDLAQRYGGTLVYGKDAFAGLDAMRWITGDGDKPVGRRIARPAVGQPAIAADSDRPRRSPHVELLDEIPEPPFWGARIAKGVAIDDIFPFLNMTALLRNQWQYRPNPSETDAQFKERMAPELRRSIAAARAGDLLVPQVAYGYFPANSDGDDLVIWEDEERRSERVRFSFPRQGSDPWLCISDFFAPIDGPCDVAAFHIVTMGAAISVRTAELFADDRYEDYLRLHGLGVEMTEALAEYWHTRIRGDLGIDGEDAPTVQGLFRQQFRGGRYSWGYPACPDLEDNQTVAELLEAKRIGIEVGVETGYQYQPEQTTSAIICHHPRAKYFIARSPKEQRSADQR